MEGGELFAAAESGSVSRIQYCLDHGVNVNVPNAQGKTALYRASLHGHVAAVRFLLHDCHANVNIVTSHQGYSCLQAASQEGHLEILQLLLDAGAHVNHQDYAYGHSALHDALHYQQVAAAELLLDYGANLLLPDHDGRTPLDLAANNRETQQRVRNYSPWHNLYQKLNASHEQVQELRQEVHLLKNLLLATTFVGNLRPTTTTTDHEKCRKRATAFQ
jgi:ankyrin repeat protein